MCAFSSLVIIENVTIAAVLASEIDRLGDVNKSG